ncbi:hypothetical protein [Longimicrobium sp.]|jgi:hypothetical protein|uniref:hypothetical protein n=1 Tax=Longimicrobium sp. TaxID=2029185 RepID=UPI002ED96A22
MRGMIRVLGQGVPAGQVRLTRSEKTGGAPVLIRSGDFTQEETGGFIRQDPEPPFGRELIYQATLEVANRHLQSNRILNPKATNGTDNWLTGTGRTIAQETAPELALGGSIRTSFRISRNDPGMRTGTLADRTLATTLPADFGPGRWFFSGRIRYTNPDIWLWNDVKGQGTWGDLRGRGTWQQVATGTNSGNLPFVTVWAAVLSPVGAVVVAPFQVLGVRANGAGNWLSFQAWVDVPKSAPAGSRLVLLHGQALREYFTSWWLTTVMVTPESEMSLGAALTYFDGDSAVPVNSGAYFAPGYNWATVTRDATMAWNGTPNASVSVFTGPSVISSKTSVTVTRPSRRDLPLKLPVYLSDPVSATLGVWFELLGLAPLSFTARATLYDVLNRGAKVAVSQRRAWASGQFTFLTKTLAEAAEAERMFDPGRILFFRNPDVRFPESDWYLHIGDVTSDRIGPHFGPNPERVWVVPFVRVERPVGLIEAASVATWTTVKQVYDTWGALKDEGLWADVSLGSA